MEVLRRSGGIFEDMEANIVSNVRISPLSDLEGPSAVQQTRSDPAVLNQWYTSVMDDMMRMESSVPQIEKDVSTFVPVKVSRTGDVTTTSETVRAIVSPIVIDAHVEVSVADPFPDVGQQTYITRVKDVLNRVRVWIRDNYRYVMWAGVVGSVAALALCSGAAFIFGGASWLGFLEWLSILSPQASLSFLGSIAVSVAKKAGLSKGVDMTVGKLFDVAKRNASVRKILEKKRVPPKIFEGILRRTGVDVNNVTYEGISSSVSSFMMQTLISSTVSVNPLSLTGFVTFTPIDLLSVGSSFSLDMAIKHGIPILGDLGSASLKAVKGILPGNKVPKVTKNVVNKSITEQQQRVATAVIEDTLQETITDIVSDIDNISDVDPAHAQKTKDVSVDTEVVSSALQNRLMNVVALASSITIGLAVTGNLDGMIELLKGMSVPVIGSLASVTQFVAGNAVCKSILVNQLLTKVGISTLLEKFSTKLSPKQVDKVNSISEALKRERDAGVVGRLSGKMVNIIYGKRYYTATELEGMSTLEIKKVATAKSVSTTGNITSIKKAILNDQIERANTLASLLSTSTRMVMQATVHTLVVGQTEKVLESVSSSLKSVQTMLTTKTEVDHKTLELQRLKTELEKSKTADQLLKDQRREEINKIKEENRRKTELKKAEDAITRAEKEVRHLNKLKDIRQKYALREVEQLQKNIQLLKTQGVIYVSPDGLAKPMPSDEYLIPEEMKAVLDREYTPLIGGIAKSTIPTLAKYIPIVGQYEYVAGMVNGAYNTVVNVGKAEALMSMVSAVMDPSQVGSAQSMKDAMGRFQTASSLGEYQVPTISNVVDSLVKDMNPDTYTALVTNVLRNGILDGWDTTRVFQELTKGVTLGSEYVGKEVMNAETLTTVGAGILDSFVGTLRSFL